MSYCESNNEERGNMKKKWNIWIWSCSALLLPMVLFTGCSIRQADLTALSTRNVSLDTVDLDKLPQVKGVTGKDTGFVFLFFPVSFPHLEDAVDEALDKGGGDVMVDAVVHSQGWWFLVGQNTIEVQGNVINTKGAN